jgi:16S rRNA (uracil1498-N3)-methyltransferase
VTARLYIDPGQIREGTVHLAGEALRHVRTVLRLGAGDGLTVTDGTGFEYALRIESLGRDAGQGTILSRSAPCRESPLRIVLAQAVPRGDRFAFVLQKAVELGVAEIAPVASRRSLPARPPEGEEARLSRWRRIVEAAVGQSGRTRLPLVHPARAWEEIVATGCGADLRLLLFEGARTGLGEVLAARSAPATVLLAAGPEGGWASEEVVLAERAGFLAARLGPRILRTETVGLAALAVLQHRWGDLG